MMGRTRAISRLRLRGSKCTRDVKQRAHDDFRARAVLDAMRDSHEAIFSTLAIILSIYM